MKTVIAAFVMILGVALIGWDLYRLYHGMPMSAPVLAVGAICAYLGSKWVQGERSSVMHTPGIKS